MKALRLIAVLLVVVLVTGALTGCGCFQQKMRGETAPGAPSTVTQISPPAGATTGEAKKEIVVPLGKKETAPAAAMVVLKDIYYDFDKYNIRPQDGDVLKQDYGWFTKNPETRVRIEGNCDERGTVEYNLVLGQKRADSAKSYLINLGVNGKLLDTISYGKEKPVDPGHNEAAWAKNRRSHFVPIN